MTAAPDIERIVDFEHPPVIEVLLGVQFAADTVDLEVLAELARELRGAYPERRQLEPLPRLAESFDRPAPLASFELRLGVPMPRTWFLSEDERYLVQIQSDRLVLNWRRMVANDPYPTFGSLRPRFDDLLATVTASLGGLGRPAPAIDAVEVTYINELGGLSAPQADRHPPLAELLSVVDEPSHDTLPPAEDASFAARYRMARDGQTVGRLTARTDASYRAVDHVPIYLLNLSATVVRHHVDDADVRGSLDAARTWIVNAFLELTTPTLQATWGQRT